MGGDFTGTVSAEEIVLCQGDMFILDLAALHDLHQVPIHSAPLGEECALYVAR